MNTPIFAAVLLLLPGALAHGAGAGWPAPSSPAIPAAVATKKSARQVPGAMSCR